MPYKEVCASDVSDRTEHKLRHRPPLDAYQIVEDCGTNSLHCWDCLIISNMESPVVDEGSTVKV